MDLIARFNLQINAKSFLFSDFNGAYTKTLHRNRWNACVRVDQFMFFQWSHVVLESHISKYRHFQSIRSLFSTRENKLKLKLIFFFEQHKYVFSNETLLIKNSWIECHGVRLVQTESFPMNNRFMCGINNFDGNLMRWSMVMFCWFFKINERLNWI